MQTTFKILFSCLFCLALTLSVAGEQTTYIEKVLPTLTAAEQAEIDKIVAKHGMGAILRYLATQSEKNTNSGENVNRVLSLQTPLTYTPVPYVITEQAEVDKIGTVPLAIPTTHVLMPPAVVPKTQIDFLGVESLVINWGSSVPGTFDSASLICPAIHEFGQGAIYRIKLSNIPGHPGKELFPTLEIAPASAKNQAFLAHNSVPIEFTGDDFDQVFSGNFVTKVVFLPNSEFQGIAVSGVATLVSTQVQPGVDPIVEAGKRGAILAVVRLSNKQLTQTTKIADYP
jgi:hypothetical protein